MAVIDIDAHHGNGTQAIFDAEPRVLTGSVHVDPGAGWFPHFLGFADETLGGGNRNLPLAPGSGDDAVAGGGRRTCSDGRDADALVVALGVDAAAGDPESPLDVTAAGFRAGRAGASAPPASPPCSCRRAATTWRRSGSSCARSLTGFEEGR